MKNILLFVILFAAFYIFINCGNENNNDTYNTPEILNIIYDSSTFDYNDTMNIECRAFDKDGDIADYTWSVSAGLIVEDNGNIILYQTPDFDTDVSISVSVSDYQNNRTQQNILINVKYIEDSPVLMVNIEDTFLIYPDTTQFNLLAFDKDGDPVHYNIIIDTSIINISYFDTNIIKLSPAANTTVVLNANIYTYDSKGNYDYDTFQIDLFDTDNFTPSPTDWRNNSIYFVFVDRFYDGETITNTLNGTYGPDTGDMIHGGDIKGIIEKLDYIQNLGFDAIWITPVIKNYTSYHGYALQDFWQVDPHFGTKTDLKDLSKALHDRGMYLILDIVCNHTADLIGNTSGQYYYNPSGWTLKYHNENIKQRPERFANLDWYHNYGPIQRWEHPYDQLGDFFALDDLKTELFEVQAALVDMYKYWILFSDCDGFRVDTVKHVNIEFWQYFCPKIKEFAKSIGKDTFLLYGEVFDGYDQNVGYYTGKKSGDTYLFDSMLYFPMRNTIQSVFQTNNPVSQIHYRYENITYYDVTSRKRLMTFIDNHDMARFLPAGQSWSYYPHLKQALAFIFTIEGTPIMYYGTEQGFDGGNDPWCREDMWDGGWDYGPSEGDNFDTSHELYQYVKKLLSIRKNNPALRLGEQTEIYYSDTTSENVYIYEKNYYDSINLIIMNISGTSYDTFPTDNTFIQTSFDTNTIVTDLMNNDTFLIDTNSRLKVVLNPYQVRILN